MVSNHTGFRITGAVFFIFAWILKIIQTIVTIPFSSGAGILASILCVIAYLLIFISLFIGGKRNVLLTGSSLYRAVDPAADTKLRIRLKGTILGRMKLTNR